MSLHELKVKNGRWTRTHNTKTWATALVIAFIVTSLLYARHVRGYSPADNGNHEIGSAEHVSYGQTGGYCLTTGQGSGHLESYCADTADNLIQAIKWVEPEPVIEPQGVPGSVSKYSLRDSCHNVVNGKCLMASGKPVYDGAVACPYDIPFGTQVKIQGRVYTCEDRTARWVQAKWPNTYDIFTYDYNEAVQYGRQKHYVEFTNI
jgi:hypothetical protein